MIYVDKNKKLIKWAAPNCDMVLNYANVASVVFETHYSIVANTLFN